MKGPRAHIGGPQADETPLTRAVEGRLTDGSKLIDVDRRCDLMYATRRSSRCRQVRTTPAGAMACIGCPDNRSGVRVVREGAGRKREMLDPFRHDNDAGRRDLVPLTSVAFSLCRKSIEPSRSSRARLSAGKSRQSEPHSVPDAQDFRGAFQ